ncbi:MAG TPA: MBL fold metallo-hydrolase, partial [Accumulibacter sp.]|nr:MBL fold metallo-hydrolase [Accumulibacter sp.]
VEAGETRALLDCGFSIKTLSARLARLGLLPEQLTAVLVTHEHSDHLAGVFSLARRYGLTVYLTHGTHAAMRRQTTSQTANFPSFRIIDGQHPFAIGNLEIQPYPVPHDAREPVQYRFADGQHRLGVLTDTGIITAHIIDTLNSCDALVLECNHDRELLTRSRYPQTLKQRIGGRYGHLANEQAAELLHQIDTSRLQHLVAAHLSQENNRPELAAKALASAVGCSAEWIGVADQDSGLDWRQIG